LFLIYHSFSLGFIISKILGAILIIISGAYFLYKLHQRQKSIQGGNGTNPQTAPAMYGGRGGSLTATDGQLRQSKINVNPTILIYPKINKNSLKEF
jgi:hypothetical protein